MQNVVQTLCAQHDEMRALKETYERELLKAEPDLAALAKCRWTLVRLVSSHLACEAMHLKVLEGRPEPVIGKMAERVAALAEQLNSHVRNWTPDAIVRDWTEYRRVSKTVMSVLAAHMDEEERALYPLLLQAKAA